MEKKSENQFLKLLSYLKYFLTSAPVFPLPFPN